MRYGKIGIGLLTAVLAAAALWFWLQEPQPQQTALPEEQALFSVQVTGGGRTEEISCWQQEGQYFVFLPSYATLSETYLQLERNEKIYVNQEALQNGQSCDAFRLGQAYSLSSADTTGTLTFLRSENIPAMYIDVPSGTMDYIHEVKGNAESGRIRIFGADGTVSFNGNLKAISGRGNATWTMQKKPYSLTLAGEADLLGLGQAQRWVLLANGSDPSHLRNKFVYDYASDAQLPYSPGSEWVDLYLNGEYAGLYQLSERNEIHPQRVALPEGSSFLVSMELGWRLEGQGYPYITTDRGFALRIRHSALTEDALLQLWQSAENAIMAEDGIDPLTGKHWTQLLDMDSWVRKYLIEEIFGSVDAGAVSQFFYGDTESGIIFAGPVWDYDIALGNAGAWQLTQPEAFFAGRSRLRANQENSWFYALLQKPEFRQRAAQLYREEFQPLLASYLTDKLDAYAGKIRAACEMNRCRWQVLQSPDEETEAIRGFMEKRMDFLTGVLLEGEQWHTVLVDTNDGANTACYAVRDGDPLPQLPDMSMVSQAVGWYYRDTDMPVDLTQPVDSDLDIYLRRDIWEGEVWEEDLTAQQLPLLKRALAAFLLILLALLGGELSRQFPQLLRKHREKPKIPHN